MESLDSNRRVQAIQRERTGSYFALLSALGAKEADRVWARVALDAQGGFPSGTAATLGRLDFDDEVLSYLRDEIANRVRALPENDDILELGVAGYPSRLAEIKAPPRFIFSRGRSALLDEPSIAVVGTRNPSDDGRRRARQLGHLLAMRGVVVTSGLAKGIDTEAHRGALDAGGNTIAVIGTPLDNSYPKENESLQDRIAKRGVVVSQFCPGMAVTRGNFPIRNATMSGLSLGTVVVEASETSGALIQAQRCLEQGRKLFIPISAVNNPALQWPERFAERGAVVFRTIDELLGALKKADLLMAEPATARPLAQVASSDVR